MTVGRAEYEPGWRWSEHVGAALGQDVCEVAHLGLVLSGRNRIEMTDGRVVEVGPGRPVRDRPRPRLGRHRRRAVREHPLPRRGPVRRREVTDAPRRVTRVAAYALCTDGDAILLSRIAQGATADSDGMWTLPGGGIDFGEDPRDAALRELTEETGFSGEIVELAGSTPGPVASPIRATASRPTSTRVRILYRVRITGGELQVEVDGSSDACAWIPRADLATLPIVELARTGARLVGLVP